MVRSTDRLRLVGHRTSTRDAGMPARISISCTGHAGAPSPLWAKSQAIPVLAAKASFLRAYTGRNSLHLLLTLPFLSEVICALGRRENDGNLDRVCGRRALGKFQTDTRACLPHIFVLAPE